MMLTQATLSEIIEQQAALIRSLQAQLTFHIERRKDVSGAVDAAVQSLRRYGVFLIYPGVDPIEMVRQELIENNENACLAALDSSVYELALSPLSAGSIKEVRYAFGEEFGYARWSGRPRHQLTND